MKHRTALLIALAIAVTIGTVMAIGVFMYRAHHQCTDHDGHWEDVNLASPEAIP